jgi:hypothetical protein
MTERKVNLTLMAVFSVLAVVFVAAVLLVIVTVAAQDSGISRSALPPSPSSLGQER